MTDDRTPDPMRPTPDEDVPADVHDRVLATLREEMSAPTTWAGRNPWLLAAASAAAVAVLVGAVVGVTRLAADSPPEVAAPPATTPVTVTTTPSAAPTTTSTATTPAPGPRSTTTPVPTRFTPLTSFGDTLLQQAWAVYVAHGSDTAGAATLTAGRASLTALGYDATPRSVSCDYDVRLSLNVPSDESVSTVVGLYFATRQEAEAFSASYPGTPDGLVNVVNVCRPGQTTRPAALTPAAGFPAQDVGPYDPTATYYGVYLLGVPIAEQGDGSMYVRLRTQLGALGYYATVGEITCATVKSQLNLVPDAHNLAVPLLFDTAAAQQQFVSSYQSKRQDLYGTATVPGSCLQGYSPDPPHS